MKKTITIILALGIGSLAHASVDMAKLAHLNGLSGTGANPYEKGSFTCSIEVDKTENTLSILQSDAYEGRISIDGTRVETVKQTADSLTLETSKLAKSKGYCGDWISARNISTEAVITKSAVQISYKYSCGLVKHVDTFSCNVK